MYCISLNSSRKYNCDVYHFVHMSVLCTNVITRIFSLFIWKLSSVWVLLIVTKLTQCDFLLYNIISKKKGSLYIYRYRLRSRCCLWDSVGFLFELKKTQLKSSWWKNLLPLAEMFIKPCDCHRLSCITGHAARFTFWYV